jgi:hypothetical protein
MNNLIKNYDYLHYYYYYYYYYYYFTLIKVILSYFIEFFN